MRPQRVLCYIPILGALAACETHVEPGAVLWMEWPAEVRSGTSFNVRLVIAEPGCGLTSYRPRISSDQSGVTFSPFFVVERPQRQCAVLRPFSPLTNGVTIGALDTIATAPKLRSSVARGFEIRGLGSVYADPQGGRFALPVRAFGTVTVRPDSPDQSRRLAAGFVARVVIDTLCARVLPIGVYRANAALVLEDQADTVGVSGAFVRGYIHQAPAPVCGQTTVFHLVSRN